MSPDGRRNPANELISERSASEISTFILATEESSDWHAPNATSRTNQQRFTIADPRICRAMREVAAVEVDDPLALEPGEKIVTLRSIRNDPLGRLHSHRQIDEAQYQSGRAFQDDWEKAERGPQAVDPTREYVDGGRMREPITERQRKAVLRLNRAERELGADGSALVHEVLVLGMTMEQIGQRRGLPGQRWIDYFARRFRECLDRLALIYGFATSNEKAAGE